MNFTKFAHEYKSWLYSQESTIDEHDNTTEKRVNKWAKDMNFKFTEKEFEDLLYRMKQLNIK